MIDEVRENCPALRRVVLMDSAEWTALVTGSSRTRDELLGALANLSADDRINIQYTSGTTGFPKGRLFPPLQDHAWSPRASDGGTRAALVS